MLLPNHRPAQDAALAACLHTSRLLHSTCEAGPLSERRWPLVKNRKAEPQSRKMKINKLICILASLYFSVLCHSNADPPTGVDTNAPAAQFFCVGGEGVLNPGRFAYHEGLTITNAIGLAGGFNRWAHTTKVELVRSGQKSALMVVDVTKIEKGQATNVTINPDDYIYVPGPTVMRLRRDRIEP